jgi:hypothetical protein
MIINDKKIDSLSRVVFESERVDYEAVFFIYLVIY